MPDYLSKSPLILRLRPSLLRRLYAQLVAWVHELRYDAECRRVRRRRRRNPGPCVILTSHRDRMRARPPGLDAAGRASFDRVRARLGFGD